MGKMKVTPIADGEKLRAYCVSHKLRPTDIAIKCGVSENTVYRWMNNKNTMPKLVVDLYKLAS